MGLNDHWKTFLRVRLDISLYNLWLISQFAEVGSLTSALPLLVLGKPQLQLISPCAHFRDSTRYKGVD